MRIMKIKEKISTKAVSMAQIALDDLWKPREDYQEGSRIVESGFYDKNGNHYDLKVSLDITSGKTKPSEPEEPEEDPIEKIERIINELRNSISEEDEHLAQRIITLEEQLEEIKNGSRDSDTITLKLEELEQTDNSIRESINNLNQASVDTSNRLSNLEKNPSTYDDTEIKNELENKADLEHKHITNDITDISETLNYSQDDLLEALSDAVREI